MLHAKGVRSQMSKCHTDLMNRFLSSTTEKKNERYKSVREVIVEGLCGFLFDSDRGKSCDVIGSRASVQRWSH